MYYIYHIPDIKIGCTTEPERRVKRQGYKDYHILEVHSDIDVASKREQELQKEYGYTVDKAPYKHSYNERVRLSGSKSKKKSISSRNNGINSGKKNSKKILQYDLEGNLVKEWNSIREAHYNTGIYRMGISRCCNNKPSYITAGGYKWKYKN